MTANSYEQLLSRLVAIDDPPTPQRASPLARMSDEEARKNTIALIVIALALGLGAWLLWHFGHWFWGGTLGLVALLFAAMVFSPKTLVAPCPYCSKQLGGLLADVQDKLLQCEGCFEYSILKDGQVRALDPATVSEIPKFESPLFQNTLWPKACVACGAPPTRLDNLSKRSMNAAMLVVGRVHVMKGTVDGVPYCDSHRDNVELLVGQNRSLRLKWCSLRMMRRYLAVNRGVVHR